MNSIELQDKKNSLKFEMRGILNKAKEEIRTLTDEEKEQYELRKTEIETINKELRNLSEKFETQDNKNISTNMNKEVRFSLLNAIRNVANNKPQDPITAEILERGQNEFRSYGMSYTGQIQIPSVEERASLTVQAEGEDVVAVDLFDVVTPIKEKNVLVLAGAKFITGLSGDVKVPRITSASVEWVDETGDAPNGEPTFNSVTLSPKRLSTVIEVSKQFLIQSGHDSERLLRELIVDAINSKLESTILGNEAGTNNKPAGLFHGANVKSISTFQDLCDFESELENVDDAKYIISNKAKSGLRNMSKSTKSTQLVMEGGEIDGTQAFVTTRMKEEKGLVYGDMSKIYITQHGPLDITLDNLTLSHKGSVRLVVSAYYDCKLVQPEAVAFAKLA